MESQAIAASQERKPIVPLTTACWAERQGVSFQRERASIVSPPTHWLPRSKPVEGSRVTSRAAARASVVGACFLWLFIGAAGDGQCGESEIRAQANIDDLAGRPTVVQRSDAAPGTAAQAPES